MRGKFRYSLAAIVFMAVGVLVPTPAGATGASTPAFVAGGLDSPRGIEFFKGNLVVGEAGHGGKNCTPAPPANPAICFGRTGQISKVNTATGSHSTLVDHLFSVMEFRAPGEGEALGVSGLSTGDGKLMAIIGVYPQAFADYQCAPGDAECAADVEAAIKEAGALLAVKANGSWRKVAGVGAYDYDWTANVPNQEHDANPYGVLAANGGAYVADAGSNTLNFVSNGGRISILQYFPYRQEAFPTDEVPTCIVKTDNALWVATLAGHLYRMGGHTATLVANPYIKHVTGCAADRNDNVYFVNMWNTPGPPNPFSGDIVKLNTERGTSSVLAAGLNFPNMDVVGPDGNLYFSADSICPAAGIVGFCPQGGTVWKLGLPHEKEKGDKDNRRG